MEMKAIEEAARNSTVAPRTILGNLTNDIVNSGNNVSAMRKTSTLNRAIQRERVKSLGFPSVPREWQEMVVPESLKITKGNENFLILETNIDIGSQEKVLTSKAQLDATRLKKTLHL